MIPTTARAAEAADKPRRSVFVYIPNGVNGMNWQVTKSGRDYDLSPSLKPLEKHRSDFTIFSGLHHPQCHGQAHVCADTWLTGAKIEAQSGRKYENTISCDQLMAEVVGRHTRIPSLELSIAAGTGQPFSSTTLAFSRDGIPLPAEDNPKLVFQRLFGEETAEWPPSGPGSRNAAACWMPSWKMRSRCDRPCRGAIRRSWTSTCIRSGTSSSAPSGWTLARTCRNPSSRRARRRISNATSRRRIPANTGGRCSISSCSPCGPT